MNLVVSQFHLAQRPTAAEEKMITVIAIPTYWTFVVPAIIPVSRFQPGRPIEKDQEWKMRSTLRPNNKHGKVRLREILQQVT